MGNCFSAVVSFLASCVYKVKSFWVRLTAASVEKLTVIRRFLTSKLQPQSLLPSLSNNTDDSKSHDLIIQNLQKLELGKFAFTLATTATLGLLFSQKLEDDDQAASPHDLIIVGFMVSFLLLYNGVVFGAINPRLGNILQLIGITLVLCLLCVLVGTLLPAGFSFACWVCAAFNLMPFLYILIKPHPGPYLQRHLSWKNNGFLVRLVAYYLRVDKCGYSF
ncbi:hypothetical protein C2S52_018944 [Perilla frutescens var. hirtella]|nr:hypothetical protein C2S52_018944 [Perilla frutescens var. hirtella]KAH6806728.1 hypothetical protein C2S51_031559 [Perilla frutescens var. frutescens]